MSGRIPYRVEVPKRLGQEGFVCGIATDENGIVIEAAPIMVWTLGKDLGMVSRWVLTTGGTVESEAGLE